MKKQEQRVVNETLYFVYMCGHFVGHPTTRLILIILELGVGALMDHARHALTDILLLKARQCLSLPSFSSTAITSTQSYRPADALALCLLALYRGRRRFEDVEVHSLLAEALTPGLGMPRIARRWF